MDSSVAKLYKNIAEKRVPNIKDINYALDRVEIFIKRHKRTLYGGMAIDLAFKHVGHEGIYTDDILPDYDFYSPENIQDSMKIARFLYEEGLESVGAINGLHLTTRRVRIDKFNFVADISFYPEPYYSRMPTITTRGFTIVHPDFQRIDLHRSLSYLYEGAPERENFKNRLEKDVKRFNMLNDLYPPTNIRSKCELSDCKQSNHGQSNHGQSNLLIDHFGTKTKIDIDKLATQANRDSCITGSLALHIICLLAGIDSPFETSKSGAIVSPDYLEIYIDDLNNATQGLAYEKTCDIFPEAIVDEKAKIIYYYNYGERISAHNTKKYGYVANVHVLAYSYLFKYFMIGTSVYHDCYLKCIELIKWGGKAKTSDAQILTNITGAYYGIENLNAPYMYSERVEQCLMVGKRYDPRPVVHYKAESEKMPEIHVNQFITYRIAGARVDAIEPKNTKCPI